MSKRKGALKREDSGSKRGLKQEERQATKYPSGSPLPEPTTDEIRERAYKLFLDRGAITGNDIEDWLRAEHELVNELNTLRDEMMGKGPKTGRAELKLAGKRVEGILVHLPIREKQPLPRSSVNLPGGTALAILNDLRGEDDK